MVKKGHEGGGGSIREGIHQYEVKGGNAVNLGCALGAVGAKVNLIAIANSMPAHMLAGVVEEYPSVKLSLIDGDAGFTVAFEFLENGRHINVMVSDSGYLAQVDGSEITKKQWNLLGRSAIIGVVNWAAMKKGNEFSEAIFSFARRRKIPTFFDPADVSELSHNLPELKRMILDKRMIDYFSMNDNEARIIAKDLASHSLPQSYSEDELLRTSSVLADLTGSRVDIHTHAVSVSCEREDKMLCHCHKVEQKIVTGAGDVWDSGDLLGYLTGLEPEDRLHFANAAAGLYVSRDIAKPPTGSEVLEFLKKQSS